MNTHTSTSNQLSLHQLPQELIYGVAIYLDKISLLCLSQVSRNLRWLLTDELWIDCHIGSKYREYVRTVATEFMSVWRIAFYSIVEIRSYYTIKMPGDVYCYLYKVLDEQNGIMFPGSFRKIRIMSGYHIRGCYQPGGLYSILYQGEIGDVELSGAYIWSKDLGCIILGYKCSESDPFIFGKHKHTLNMSIYNTNKTKELNELIGELESMDLLCIGEELIDELAWD